MFITNNHKLEYLKSFLNLSKNDSHNAFDDCSTTSELYLHLKKLSSLKEQPKNESVIVSSNSVSEKSFVLTGSFLVDRDPLVSEIISKGGLVKSCVSKRTDYLVEGVQTALNIIDGISSKQLKAMDLIKDGFNIKIIDERQLSQLLAIEEEQNV